MHNIATRYKSLDFCDFIEQECKVKLLDVRYKPNQWFGCLSRRSQRVKS